ncbi:MAG TPA: hypothetical protein VFQ43_21335, partial [Nitrososphaera sp.]|nr:hypothetical protein [Nitrososphaera sp.]
VPFSVTAALGNPLWATSTDGKDKMMDIKIPHFRILSPRLRAITSVMREGATKTSRAPIFYCDKNVILSEP